MSIKIGSIYCDNDGFLYVSIEKMNFSYYACISCYTGNLNHIKLVDDQKIATKQDLKELTLQNLKLTIIGIFNL